MIINPLSINQTHNMYIAYVFELLKGPFGSQAEHEG